MAEAIFYKGRDNAHDLQLLENGVAINHTAITRCRIEVDGYTADSSTDPAMFTLGQSDRITLKLGAFVLALGVHTAKVVIYDASHPNGLVWSEISLDMRA